MFKFLCSENRVRNVVIWADFVVKLKQLPNLIHKIKVGDIKEIQTQILQRIGEIEKTHETDLTGENQHGIKI